MWPITKCMWNKCGIQYLVQRLIAREIFYLSNVIAVLFSKSLLKNFNDLSIDFIDLLVWTSHRVV